MRARTRSVSIGGGTLKGRVLQYPDDAGLRPSTQLAKNSLFSSLGSRLTGAVFADLCAGAGGVGIEALSRGAAFVHFVEKERAALAALARNLAACGIQESRYRVHAAGAESVLDAGALADTEIAFADPPYAGDVASGIAARVNAHSLPVLTLLVIEHASRGEVVGPAGWQVLRSRRFGDTTLTSFEPATRAE